MFFRKLVFCLTSLALLCSSSVLLAQEEGPSDASSVEAPEDREEQKEDDEQKLETNFFLTSEVHSMNNLDLRELDETSDESILLTDDRATFAYTGLAMELEYDVLDDTEFNFGGAHTGLWGNDQLGGLSGESIRADEGNRAPHFIWIYDLSASWEPVDTESFGFETTIGRQPFEIGGAEEDFFFDDTIDGITLDLDAGIAGALRVLALDFYATNSEPKGVDFVDYVATRDVVAPFRGDTNTLRFGGVYENTELLDGLDFRAFGFFADIGASTRPGATGADRSVHGSLGNASDADYAWMAGTRFGYTWESEGLSVGGFGEFARSGGIDRKDVEIGLRDVVNEGNAYGGGIHGSFETTAFGVDAKARYFHADGGQYTGDSGIQFSHGFVSFKGDEVGGLNLDRYVGVHPSAYVTADGVLDTPNSTSRRAGTDVIHGGVGISASDWFRADFDAWYLIDTSNTELPPDKIDEVASNQPFGYTEADLQAQRRFGKPIGAELDASLLFRANKALSFYTKGGVFLPSEFYEIEIDRSVAGDYTALGSEDPQTFWAVAGGTSLSF